MQVRQFVQTINQTILGEYWSSDLSRNPFFEVNMFGRVLSAGWLVALEKFLDVDFSNRGINHSLRVKLKSFEIGRVEKELWLEN